MQNIRIKAAIFDMDGVITNTMPDHYKAWYKIFHDINIPVTHLDIYRREGQPGLVTVREMFAEHDRPFRLSEAKKILRRKEDLFKKIVKQRFIVGARRFLKSFHSQGIRLALVTGTSRHELHRILPKSLYNLFDITVTGNDVEHGKPHPEPYLKGIKGLELKKSEVIVFENAPFGIESAKRAGLTCFAIETSLPRKYLKEADKIHSSIREMNQKIKFIKA